MKIFGIRQSGSGPAEGSSALPVITVIWTLLGVCGYPVSRFLRSLRAGPQTTDSSGGLNVSMVPADVVVREVQISFTDTRQYRLLIQFLAEVEIYAVEIEDADLLDLVLGYKADLVIAFGEMVS
jgi:hypothetical protein